MKENPIKKTKKEINPRREKLQKDIGITFRVLRKKLGYTSVEHFANAQDLDRAHYGKYETGAINMTIGGLLETGIALGLREEDIFNKDFLALGKEENELNNTLINSQDNTINQVRNQVKAIFGETESNKLDNDDIKRLYLILISCQTLVSKKEIITKAGLAAKTPNFEMLFNLAKDNEWIAMTHPETPNISNQKYYTTDAGKEVLKLK